MARITIDQVRICYEKALEAHYGPLTTTQAVSSATQASGMKAGSALDYVYNIQGLLNGRTYTRTMNEAATRSILGWIKEDFGKEACLIAARAVLEHTEYYKGLKTGGTLHGVVAAADSILSEATKNEIGQADFQRNVYASLIDDADARHARLAKANPVPTYAIASVISYRRNPDVVAEVLARAKGNCEKCGHVAPFQRMSDRTPYLEVHHKIPLAEKGKDTVANAMALCPNCHREAHYGEHWATFRH